MPSFLFAMRTGVNHRIQETLSRASAGSWADAPKWIALPIEQLVRARPWVGREQGLFLEEQDRDDHDSAAELWREHSEIASDPANR